MNVSRNVEFKMSPKNTLDLQLRSYIKQLLQDLSR